MTLNTYCNIGTILFWTGVVVGVISLFLFLAVSKGISIGSEDELHLHDTYYIMFNWGHRLMLLLPLIAGLLIMVSGLLIRSQAPIVEGDLEQISRAEQGSARQSATRSESKSE